MFSTIQAFAQATPASEATSPELPTAFTDVKTMSDLGPLSQLKAEVGRMLDLREDWDGEGGEPIAADAVHGAAKFLTRLAGIEFLPWVSPTSEGGVRVEWNAGENFLSVEFEPSEEITVVCQLPDQEEPVVWSNRDIPSDLSFAYQEIARSKT